MTMLESYDFPKYVYDSLDGKGYSIGIYGMNMDKYLPSMESVDLECENILKNGLDLSKDKSVNNLISFVGRIDDKFDLNKLSMSLRSYRNGNADKYILVAVPVDVKNKNGEHIYIGKSNGETVFSKCLPKNGSNCTSLADLVVCEDNHLPSEFILGSYSVLPTGDIEFVENPNHISKNDGYVNDNLFDEIKTSVFSKVFSSDSLFSILTKDELTSDDYNYLNHFISKYSSSVYDNNKNYLIPVLETLIQLLDEKQLEKVDHESLEEERKDYLENDYSIKYEGLEEDELFRSQHDTYKSLDNVTLYEDGSESYIFGDTDYEAEEYYKLLNNKEFIMNAFENFNKFEIARLCNEMLVATNDNLLKDEDIALNMFKNSRDAFLKYDNKGLLTRELVEKAASTSSFNKDSLYFLPMEYYSDYDLICKFIENSNVKNFGFYNEFGDSKVAYLNIDRSIKSNPDFYERLNNKIKELNEKGADIPFFNSEEEINLAKGRSK